MRLKNGWPIGIFDSGLGGLTVVREVRRALPHEDVIYLGDTARVPYGTKSPSTVIRFACEDTEFLLQHKVKIVVVACNTASAWALPTLRKRFDVPIFGVIVPGARAALAKSQSRRIGVIGTTATIRSQAYPREILALDRGAKVFARACPLLVPLVEEGWMQRPVTALVIAEYLQPLLRSGIDTLVLGCTHYPLLKRAIRRTVQSKLALVDSAATCAQYVRAQLEALGLLCFNRPRPGRLRLFVTDEVDRFEKVAKRFLGRPIHGTKRIDLPV